MSVALSVCAAVSMIFAERSCALVEKLFCTKKRTHHSLLDATVAAVQKREGDCVHVGACVCERGRERGWVVFCACKKVADVGLLAKLVTMKVRQVNELAVWKFVFSFVQKLSSLSLPSLSPLSLSVPISHSCTLSHAYPSAKCLSFYH